MKTELKLRDHEYLEGQKVIEIWWGNMLIGTVTGTDNVPGVRVLSKFPKEAHSRDKMLVEVLIEVKL